VVFTNIIGKYIYKSIAEKKLRTALIILSIAVSAALYFASTSISDTMVKVQTDRWRASVGYTDIMVQAWWESPSRYFSQELLNDMGEYLEYAVGTVSGYGLYQYAVDQNLGVNLWGIDYNELRQITPVNLVEEADINPFVGKKIIISRYTANKFKFRLGDSFPLDINGSKHKFIVSGIAESEGPFIGDGEAVCGVVPVDTLRSLYNVRGKVDALYVKLLNRANKQQMLRILDSRYKMYHVSEPFTEQEIRSQNNKVRMPFLALTIILSFMSIYIINSTFKVITFERLPDIGTFRSIGARKNSINRMLLQESLFYGVAGGAVGCLLGLGVLYLMSIFTMPSWEDGYRATISFEPKQLLLTFGMAVLLCLISSVKPILKVNKIPIKEIILNAMVNNKSSRVIRTTAGLVLMCFGLFAPILIKGKFSTYINTICIVAVIAAMVMLIPFLTKGLIRILERGYAVVFGNIGAIAVKNLRENRSINGSISLLAIGISCALFVNTLSYSALTELINYYDRNNYEIYMSAKNADLAYLQAIRTTPGVKAVSEVMGIGGIEIVNKNDAIGLTQGVDTDNYLSYNDIQLAGNRQEVMDLLDRGRGILLTNRLRERFNLKLGEELRLRAWGNVSTFQIVGFFNSIENSGNYGIISDKYMKLDMGWENNFYSTLFIKTEGDPEQVVKELKTRFAKQQPLIQTIEEMKHKNILYNQQLFLIAKGFSIITMLAGILGIFNNLIINFIQRRRHLAMYRSIGMSKTQIIQMMLMEAFTLGVIGSLAGVVSGMLMIISGAGLLRSLEMEVNIHYSGLQLVMCLIFGVLIALFASVWPALKSSKLNLMEAIKYE
jgi:putative ABC transport system permease protein